MYSRTNIFENMSIIKVIFYLISIYYMIDFSPKKGYTTNYSENIENILVGVYSLEAITII